MRDLHGKRDRGILVEEDLSDQLRNSVCSLENWLAYDQCDSYCPIRLVVTSPPEYKMDVCLTDSEYKPYVHSQHIDVEHPLHNKTFEIFALQKRKGCDVSEYSAAENKIVVGYGNYGGCKAHEMALFAKQNRAALSLDIDDYLDNTITKIGAPSYWRDGTGTLLADHPVLRMPAQYGNVITDAVLNNVTLHGKVVLNCDPLPAVTVTASNREVCPDHRLSFACANQTLEQNRMCRHCAAMLSFAGLSTEFCLIGNNLQPRAASSLLLKKNPAPMSAPAGEVVYLSNLPEVARDICITSFDGAGLAGKIVIIPEQVRNCRAFSLVQSAHRNSIKAIIFITKPGSSSSLLVEGPSQFTDVAVHTLVKEHQAAFLINVTSLPGVVRHGTIGWALPDAVFSLDMSVSMAAFQDVLAPAEEEVEVSIETAPLAICIVLMVVELVVIVALVYHGWQSRRREEEESYAGEDKGKSVPLGVASTGLSLSLLLATAVVAFVLAYAAGQSSTDIAIKDGQAATDQTYFVSTANAAELSVEYKHAVTDGVKVSCEKILDQVCICTLKPRGRGRE